MVEEERQTQSARPDWLRPSIEQHSLRQYLTTLKKSAWVVVLAVLLTTGATAVYLALAEKVYEAEADVLVTPVPGDDRLLRGLGLIASSADPEREIETVSRLITARDVRDRVDRQLERVDLDRVEVTAEPVAESNIVVVTARAPTPRLARRAANGFARIAIDLRTKHFQSQLEQSITTLEEQALRAERAGALVPAGELARLKALRGRPDPTVRVEVEADNPAEPIWPKPALSLAVAVLAGLVLGTGAVFLWQLFDPRLRREEDLKQMFGLPILARIPMERSLLRRRGALGPNEISAPGIEAFRALRFSLIAAQESLKGGGSLFITGPSPSEGKTTTCINLAVSLASMGQKVILIEADLRRPAIGPALGLKASPHGVASVLIGRASMEDSLVTSEAFGENLSILLADEEGEWMADQLSLPGARDLVSQAEELADFVIIDSPPVIDVTDTLPLAREADDVVLVTRLGKSRLDELEELGELLAQQAIEPLGFVLLGVGRSRSNYYYTSDRARGVRGAEAPTAYGGETAEAGSEDADSDHPPDAASSDSESDADSEEAILESEDSEDGGSAGDESDEPAKQKRSSPTK